MRKAKLSYKGEPQGVIAQDDDGTVKVCMEEGVADSCLVAQGGDETWELAKSYFSAFGLTVEEE